MTLIYATREKAQISFFSDTKSTDPLDVKADNFSNFTLKVLPISSDLTIAFAGVVKFGYEAIEHVYGNASVEDVKKYLLEFHKNKRKSVDFLLASQSEFKLYKIADGQVVRQKHSCWIGSKSAFESFQEVKHAGPQETFDMQMGVVWMGEEGRPETSNTYASNLDAFFEVVLQNRNGVGGFALPYLITRHYRTFGTYLKSFRKPLSANEVGSEGRTVKWLWNKPDEGAYTVNLGGNETSFSLHVPQAGRKITWRAPESSIPMATGFDLG
ncbi:hypothetical protein [Phaeobacter sp. HF9A]|uniref:hypothetical protein n=1 Tax=Phaeobacter sp. HF9A TaxID=2721561 RepID=UPI001431C3A0|nr:hypothetical protein [Phaeobacter sp. HF9A]NIZ12690.1 hypothetical protein [Phaeobacter sp. HF9A]